LNRDARLGQVRGNRRLIKLLTSFLPCPSCPCDSGQRQQLGSRYFVSSDGSEVHPVGRRPDQIAIASAFPMATRPRSIDPRHKPSAGASLPPEHSKPRAAHHGSPSRFAVVTGRWTNPRPPRASPHRSAPLPPPHIAVPHRTSLPMEQTEPPKLRPASPEEEQESEGEARAEPVGPRPPEASAGEARAS